MARAAQKAAQHVAREREREPWRRMLPGLLTLVFHVIILMLLPGLAMPPALSPETPPPILIQLDPAPVVRHSLPKAPAEAGLDPQTAGGLHAMSPDPQDGQAAVRQSAPGSNLHPSAPRGANPLSPSPQAGQPAPPAQGGTANSGPEPPDVQPNEANDVMPLPRPPVYTPAPVKQHAALTQPAPPAAAKPSPQQPSASKSQAAPRPPSAVKPATGKPTTQSGGAASRAKSTSTQPAAAKPGGGQSTVPSAPGNAKPGPQTAHPAAKPAPGNGSGPSGLPGNGGGKTPGAPEIPAPEGRTAPDFGAPALPAGPGSGELNILSKYGDHCMAEIKKQARNPERAREKWHDQGDNWGTVTFKFEVSQSGKLLDVQVVSDGGFAPFGEEVAEATRVAAQYFGPWSKYGTVASVDSWTFTRKLKFPLY